MTDVADADSEREDDADPDAEGADVDAGGPEDRSKPGAEADSGETERSTDEPTDAPDDLIARVAAADEEAAAEVEALARRVDELEAELEEREAALESRGERIEELESKVTRARADFQNYKKRAKQREEELRERATEDLVERLLDVRDNLVRALEQDDDVEVRDGVEATLSTFDRVLDGENVSAIDPAEGGDVDPERHEVVHRTESERPEGAIVDVYRPGYEMAGKVLRPAQVTVSEGSTEGAGESAPGESDAETED